MKKNGKKALITGMAFVILFLVWTLLIQKVDVQLIGQRETSIGFATFNSWFHQLTGVHRGIYNLTDWLGLIPVFICIGFGGRGLFLLIKRRSLLKVDRDILLLGIYDILVILGYLIFEMVPINYRPVLIEGVLEASYPSSTTLLTLSVMLSLMYQANHRSSKYWLRKGTNIFSVLFSLFMICGRLLCGVHWCTDIIGGVLLSFGLFGIYRGAALLCCRNQ